MPLCWTRHSLRAINCPNLHHHLFIALLLIFITSCWTDKGNAEDIFQATKFHVDPGHICYNFTVGNPKLQELYSPRYGVDYPNSTHCNCLLEAPPGQVIEIDFRDRFEMELSPNCSNDALEVRDGRGGHALLLQRLCGILKFPPKIRSSGQYMWLRFDTDDSLEYKGFKIVYSFHLDLSTVIHCWYPEINFEGIIGTENITSDYRNYIVERGYPLDCMWIINVTANHATSLVFWSFNLETPNDCSKNSLDVYKDNLLPKDKSHSFCGTSARNFSHNSSVTYLHLRSEGLQTKFRLHYTAFRSVKSDLGCDPETEFDCRDTTCIHSSLRCNKRINCKYLTDEEGCSPEEPESILEKENVMIILVIGLLLLLSICISMSVSCVRQWREIQKKRQELASRRSVHSGMDRIDPVKSDGLTNLGVITVEEVDDDGCYVPEVDLSIFHKRSNGGNAIAFDQETPMHDKIQPPQLFRHQREKSASPPLPPLVHFPPVATIDSCHRSNNINVYLEDDEDDDEAQDIFPPPPTRLQDHPAEKRRPYRADMKNQRSRDPPKAAPDVIGRH